ncbi:MAG: hypothetical protein HY812_03205 [Planctomycetes bacterium]|nr:hypothetical protein [Planctomycetota bacterium]
MAAVHTLPAPAQLGFLLGSLFGKAVKVSKAAKIAANVRSKGTLATFVAEDGKAAAVIHFDLAASCSAGAALALIPASVAADGERHGSIPDNLLENLSEVYNIARGWFQAGPPLRLSQVLRLPAELPKDAQALLLKPAERVDLTLEIPGYKSGAIAVFLL